MIRQLSKRASIVVCAVFLIAVSIMPAFAQSKSSSAYAVTDDANYFSSAQFDTLCTSAESAGNEVGFQVAIHTSNDGVDSSEMDSYYNKYHDSDSTYQPDGVMLVFDIASNNRIILTYGSAEKYFDDARMDQLKQTLKPLLSSGDFYNASITFIETVKNYYHAGVDENGSYSNIVETPQNDEPKILTSLKKFGWIGGIAGVVIAIIFVLVNVGRYKYNGKGGTYDLNKNSQMNLVDSQDVFVSKHTTYTTIQSSSSSGGSSSGGSSSHGSSGSF